MLSEQLQDFLGLVKQLITNLLGKDAVEWANELKKFLRKEPSWAEEMIYTPLEWSSDLGEVSIQSLIPTMVWRGWEVCRAFSLVQLIKNTHIFASVAR